MVFLDYDILGVIGISSGEGVLVYMDLNVVGFECIDNVVIFWFVFDIYF